MTGKSEEEVRAMLASLKAAPTATAHDPSRLTAWQVKDIRSRLGLTQEGMADTLCITLRTYQRWEKGAITRAGSKAMRLLEKRP